MPRHFNDVEHEAPHMHLVALAHETIIERARLGVVEVRVRQKHLALPQRHAKLEERIAHTAHTHFIGRTRVNHQAIAVVAHDVTIRLARA